MSGLIVALTRVDERLLRALLLERRPWADSLMRALTLLGDARFVTPVTLALALGAIPFLREAGAMALWALAGSHALVQLVKRSVRRPRPTLPVGLGFLVEPEDRFSFPSGHSAAGLSLAMPIAVALGGAPGAVLLVLGLCVGVSRSYLGVHYPGDVVAGWSLAGMACAIAFAVAGLPS